MGMTCGACVHRVESALRGVAGVSGVSVDLLTESASVTNDEAEVPCDQLIGAVRSAGYDAQVAETAAELFDRFTDDTRRNDDLRRQRRDLTLAISLALPIIVLEYVPPPLLGLADHAHLAIWLAQIVLLVLLAVSPAGAPILLGGLRALRHHSGNMDLLISMGVAVAFASSLYGVLVSRRHEFIHLHAAAMILALVCLGRYLEFKAKGRASAAMAALAKRTPRTAILNRNGQLVAIPVEQIEVGDVINVPAHATIPTDGQVMEGTAAVDESLMTGEPMPVRRQTGDAVLGGTLVTEGMLAIRATAVGSRSALGRIVQLVARAQTGRTRMQRLADQVAAVFTPIVIGIAAVVFATWLVAGGKDALSSATRSAVAVLVVACPCALGLATPTVVLVASGLAALRGILVRDAGMLEAMGRIDLVVWDKTGTLTSGKPSVRAIVPVAGSDERSILEMAAAAEQFSSHPLAQAIVARARRDGIALREPTAFESSPGSGVTATLDGKRVVVGSRRFLQSAGIDVLPWDGPAAKTAMTDTIVAVAADGRAVGIIALADAIRPSSAEAVRRLRSLGVESEMLTGDQEESAQAIAGQVGIALVLAAVDPAGKVTRIEGLRRSGRRVAMVGDGVNDAAALAAADVGVAFATGADVATETAGINLIGSTPHLVADAVELARASLRVIRQNLFWAFFYNVLMIPLAATGKLPPAVAAGAMMVSSLTVVLNALRLPWAARWQGSRGAMA
jgi:P-type Cu+ transporter